MRFMIISLVVALAFAQAKSGCDACVEATRQHCKEIIKGNMEVLADAPESCTESKVDCMPFLLNVCKGDVKVDCEGHFEELSVHCDEILNKEFSGPIPDGFSPLCIPEIEQKCADMKNPCATCVKEVLPVCDELHRGKFDNMPKSCSEKCAPHVRKACAANIDCDLCATVIKGKGLCKGFLSGDVDGEPPKECDETCIPQITAKCSPCGTCLKEVVPVCNELKMGKLDNMPKSCTEECGPEILKTCAANVDCDLCATVVKGKGLCKDFLSKNMDEEPPKECDPKCVPEITAKCSANKEEPTKPKTQTIPTGCCGTDNCSKDLFEKETQPLCEKCLHSQQCVGFQAAYEKRPDKRYASGSVYCCPDSKRCVDKDPANRVSCPSGRDKAQCGRYQKAKCGGRMTRKPNYPFNCKDCGNTNWIQDWISDLEVHCKSTFEVAETVSPSSDDIYMVLVGGLIIFNIAAFSYLQWQKKRDSSYVALLEEE